MVTGVFEIYRAGKGEYRFRYRASSGEVVATSAAYPTRAEAKKAMAGCSKRPMAQTVPTDRAEDVDGVGQVSVESN